MNKECNLIWESYQQVSEEFRDEAHIDAEPSRQQARIWFQIMKVPGPRTFGEGEDPTPYLQKTVREFITVFSKDKAFNVVQGANEMGHLIADEFGEETASAVLQPVKGLIDSHR